LLIEVTINSFMMPHLQSQLFRIKYSCWKFMVMNSSFFLLIYRGIVNWRCHHFHRKRLVAQGRPMFT